MQRRSDGLRQLGSRAARHFRQPARLPALLWTNLTYLFSARASEQRRDRRLGIDAAGTIATDHLDPIGDSGTLGNWYVPTPALIADHLIKRVVGRARQSVFVDYGAGKGRVVVLAARYPFSKVMGVEHSPALVDLARQNIARASARDAQLAPLEIVLADATAWELPARPLVLFFYYPFETSIMEKVAERIVASGRDSPRKLFLLFFNSDPYEAVFKRHFPPSLFRREIVDDLPRDRTAPAWGHRAVIFESLP